MVRVLKYFQFINFDDLNLLIFMIIFIDHIFQCTSAWNFSYKNVINYLRTTQCLNGMPYVVMLHECSLGESTLLSCIHIFSVSALWHRIGMMLEYRMGLQHVQGCTCIKALCSP